MLVPVKMQISQYNGLISKCFQFKSQLDDADSCSVWQVRWLALLISPRIRKHYQSNKSMCHQLLVLLVIYVPYIHRIQPDPSQNIAIHRVHRNIASPLGLGSHRYRDSMDLHNYYFCSSSREMCRVSRQFVGNHWIHCDHSILTAKQGKKIFKIKVTKP